MPNEFVNQQVHFDSIRQLLGKAIRAAPKRKGRPMQIEDEARVKEALQAVAVICDAFREALFEQVHSFRVKHITDDFKSLVALMRTYGDRNLTSEEQAKVRARIKTWHYESRRWVADLPMQPIVRSLPNQASITRLKACWLEAKGACFSPPPRRKGAMAEGVPSHFQVAPLSLPADWGMDAMDAMHPDDERPKWECRPVVLIELLDYAREALLLEVGGSDRGGKTTFFQRRRRASLKDALAFSCITVYERTVGPKSARQSQPSRRGASQTLFEEFVARVWTLATGGEGPRDWVLGPDPVRNAISTQRAWQKLFRTARACDYGAFLGLSLEVQKEAMACLNSRELEFLRSPALPWV